MLGASPLLKSPLMTDTAANPERGLIHNEPDDWHASRCGHNFEIAKCPYEHCKARDLLRDAARYRWIIGNGVDRLDDLYDTCNWEPAPGQIAALIDTEIAREKADSRNV